MMPTTVDKMESTYKLTTSSLIDSNMNISSRHTYSNVCYGVIGSHTIKNMSYNVQTEPEMVNNVCYGIVGGHMRLAQ